MSEKHKKGCKNPNYFENFLIFISALSCCDSISTFTPFVADPVGITNSAIKRKIWIKWKSLQQWN